MTHMDGARRLTAVDNVARTHGVRAGQTAADATALFGALRIIEADAGEDLRALTRIADWCTRFSPTVAIDTPDGLFLDIDGCAHLWGDEIRLVEILLDRLDAQGLPARAAVAPTFGAAWAMARYAQRHDRILVGDVRPHLSRLPIAALRAPKETQAKLSRLGLKTIGHIMALPRGSLRKRFDPGLLLQLDRALGHESEAIVFRQAPTEWLERRVFRDGLMTAEQFTRTLHDLADRLCERLHERGVGARTFEALLHRSDGETAERTIRLALPLRDAKRLTGLFAPKLETIDPGFGVEVMTLRADAIAPLDAAQSDFATSEDGMMADLAPLIDRLANRLGEDRLWRAKPYESHVPERACVAAAPLDTPAWPAPDANKPRPIRLFERPEPIETIAALPDAPPRSFRWRGRSHTVAKAEGPERIGAEWWRQPWAETSDSKVRDYYRIEDTDGARFWLFRAGLYDSDAPPRWWMHGLFA